MPTFPFIVLFSALSFAFYGASCLTSPHMREEFSRYRLGRYRILTGILEIAGAAGLAVGLFIPWIGLLAAVGLSLLMLLGFIVRRRIGDPLLRSFPALLYLILNAYITVIFLSTLLNSQL